MKYLALFALLPLFFVALSHHSQSRELELIHDEVAMLYRGAALREAKQWQNRQAREHYHGTSGKLTTFPLLAKEATVLRSFLEEDPTLPSKEIAERLSFLQEENRLVFTEGDFQTDAQVQESIETLKHPVECDLSDLIALLDHLEAEDTPQLLVRNFSLKRKENMGNNETFLLDLQLIKREYL